MTLAQFPQLARLPKHQRMKLAEELWFSGVDDSAPVSALHRKILDERWRAYRAGRTARIPLAELERRVRGS